MLAPSDLGLEHSDDGEDGGADGAGIMTGADPFERGAEGLLVAGKVSIAYGGAGVRCIHDQGSSIGPASAGPFFVVANCCYARSRSCPRCPVAR
jgi:hypothetical protein